MRLLRPTLVPGLARSWRGPRTLQLGADPARAVLIDLPDPRGAAVLDLLDGSRSERAVLTRSSEYGLAPADARDLIDTLRAAGLVVPAHTVQPPAPWLSGEAAALALRDVPPVAPVSFLRPPAPPSAPAPTQPPAPPPAPAPPRPPAPSAPPPAPAPARPSAPSLDPAPAGPPAPAATPRRSAPNRSPPPGRAPSSAAAAPRFSPPALTPALVLRQRAAARVSISGHGRLGAVIAVALAEAGVGHIHPDLSGAVTAAEVPGGPLRSADVGQARVEAVEAALVRASPTIETRAVRRGTASLVIQLGHDQPVGLLAAAHLRRRQPHLAVSLREGVAAIGPLVPATGRPCLNCLDLHRKERDPDWAEFLPTSEPCAVTTLMAAAAFAAAEALTFLDGGTPDTLGATIQITAAGRFRRRTWHPHPQCSCARIRR